MNKYCGYCNKFKSQETGSIVAANKQVKFRCADCEAKRHMAMKGK